MHHFPTSFFCRCKNGIPQFNIFFLMKGPSHSVGQIDVAMLLRITHYATWLSHVALWKSARGSFYELLLTTLSSFASTTEKRKREVFCHVIESRCNLKSTWFLFYELLSNYTFFFWLYNWEKKKRSNGNTASRFHIFIRYYATGMHKPHSTQKIIANCLS